MISEVENIIKGSVEKSADYDATRKLIGVAVQNLTPNAQGEVALAKQGAFVVEKKEEPALETLENEVAKAPEEQVESLDLGATAPVEAPNTIQQNSPEQAANGQTSVFTSELNNNPPAVESAPVLENPISVENPDNLSKLVNPLEQKAEEPAEQTVNKQPEVIMDLQMPTLPTDVVTNEPTVTNEDIFETNIAPMPTEQIELPKISPNTGNSAELVAKPESINIEIPKLEEMVPNDTQKEKEEINNQDEIIIAKIDELTKEFNQKIEELKNMIKAKTNNMSSSIPVNDGKNTLVNDALNQINNMVVPTAENTLKL